MGLFLPSLVTPKAWIRQELYVTYVPDLSHPGFLIILQCGNVGTVEHTALFVLQHTEFWKLSRKVFDCQSFIHWISFPPKNQGVDDYIDLFRWHGILVTDSFRFMMYAKNVFLFLPRIYSDKLWEDQRFLVWRVLGIQVNETLGKDPFEQLFSFK